MHAEPGESDLGAERPWALAFHLAAAPAGSLAAEIERNVTSRLSIAAAAGFAVGGRQYAAMARLRQVVRHDIALGLGGGLSFGDYEKLNIFPDTIERWRDVTWVNGEVFYESRKPSGFQVRAYAGLSQIVKAGAREVEPDEPVTLPDLLPYAGVALGVTF